MKTMVAAIVLAVMAAPAAFADNAARSWQQEIDLQGANEIEFEVPVAELEVQGEVGRNRVQIFVEADCEDLGSRCQQVAKDLTWKAKRLGDRLQIELEGWPNSGRRAPELEIRVLVPADANLRLEVGVGEVKVLGVRADVTIEAGVGEVTVRSAEATTRSVSLETGVGETSLRPRQPDAEESGFIGRELRWSGGPGEHSIRVDVGVGEIDVVLD